VKEEKRTLESLLEKGKDHLNEIEKDLRRTKLDLQSTKESNSIM